MAITVEIFRSSSGWETFCWVSVIDLQAATWGHCRAQTSDTTRATRHVAARKNTSPELFDLANGRETHVFWEINVLQQWNLSNLCAVKNAKMKQAICIYCITLKTTYKQYPIQILIHIDTYWYILIHYVSIYLRFAKFTINLYKTCDMIQRIIPGW